jgi:hypothetical protein
VGISIAGPRSVCGVGNSPAHSAYNTHSLLLYLCSPFPSQRCSHSLPSASWPVHSFLRSQSLHLGYQEKEHQASSAAVTAMTSPAVGARKPTSTKPVGRSASRSLLVVAAARPKTNARVTLWVEVYACCILLLCKSTIHQLSRTPVLTLCTAPATSTRCPRARTLTTTEAAL